MDDCLAQAGLTRRTARIDLGDMSNFGGGEFRLPLYDALVSDPYKIPAYARAFQYGADSQAKSLLGLVAFASGKIDALVRRSWLENPHEKIEARVKEPGALGAALEAVYERGGQKVPKKLQRRLARERPELTPEISNIVAFLLLATVDALRWRDQALARAGEELDLSALASRLLSNDEGDSADERRLMHLIDRHYVICGAEDLASAVDKAVAQLGKLAEIPDQSFQCETPLGQVVVGGQGEDSYPEGEYLLILDLGGDDSYAGGAAVRSFERPASVLIDLAGDDRYESTTSQSPSWAGAMLGSAFLVDLAGNDSYIGRDLSQGAGMYGVGGLLDLAGDDQYTCHKLGQGAGYFGVGVLSDCAGKDRYTCLTTSQGYGFVRGLGLLLDSDGDDVYVADDENIEEPSPQSKEHNASLSQGFGFGLRADYTDGHSLCGGVGLLLDKAGNDKYSCGVFGQGAGYWYGTGLLVDGAGDDEYQGVWYVQAAGAHFAIGGLVDEQGRDTYRASHNMAQGAGHDFSVGYFVDAAGNDTYHAPNLSLGGGNANGLGFFHDVAGDDTYDVTAPTTLGRANIGRRGGLRDLILSLGVFLDTGGKDTYPEKYNFAGDGKRWRQRGTNTKQPLETEIGVGLDSGSE